MKKKATPVLIVLLLILLVSGTGVGVHLAKKYLPTKEVMSSDEYYGILAEGETVLMLDQEILTERGRVQDDQIYLPISVVTEKINQRFYWDEEGGQVLYATPSEIMRWQASEEAGGEIWKQNDTVFLNVSVVQTLTDLDAALYQEPARAVLRTQFENLNTVQVTKGAYVRYRGGIKSPVLTQVGAGEKLIVLEEYEEWYQVAAPNGYIGFVRKKDVSVPALVTETREFQREEYTYLTMDEKVNLIWHQVTNMDANGYLASDTENMTGVNVISPTWYSIIDNQGNISSLASAEYVATAHASGWKVWGLIDNFSADISTETVLSSFSARQNMISQLIQSALTVGLDGINVDFETLSEASGVHFLEFLRELSIECHKNQLVLSVDNPVPEDFTSHYDRAEQGRIADYVIIMGYDEHYYGSDAGSVASLPWVERGIQNTLEEVPAERVINGMPFYTRLWKTQAGTLSSEAIGMETAAQTIEENQVETYWDNTVSQNVGSWETEEASYKIWLEDDASIAEKVKLANNYNLAGVAIWRLGFENETIWKTISDNLG